MGGQKFAVLLCAEDSDYVKKMYLGYFGVFVRMLEEEGEIWDKFRVSNGEFPEDEKIGEYDGFVITGSGNDAHGNDLWICKLLNLLKKLDGMKKKVLGICFGHQILGRALGGNIGRASSGWDIGITNVYLQSSATFRSLKLPASLSIIECHRDEVLELPPNAEVMAWSNKTGIEMFRYGDHIMGIQGHPEYTKDILLNLINRLLNRDLIQESFAEEAKSKLEGNEPHKEAWKKLCIGFLKGRM
ncbi:gamma-glutamyl peptidase 5-like [Olea europaea var. sylvestris]|uniref:Gamma-glutamyl peptidase 5-like n=1 Tax=Olea europaea subsp. europaea TaxID=158383 RepID=A0A8S0T3I0_OLEEU|nr:gamma-glutamyl peptidase 5-like [Olea europaea var. sylvestris]CAA2998935.1 gamma-glutamyl peptidase 5-like [Olea europaea subsp. europaea]